MLPGYMDVLENNNAIPMILPLSTCKENLDKCFELVDGILFTGGHDINPKLYNQKKKDTCGLQCDRRDEMEKYLFEKSIKIINLYWAFVGEFSYLILYWVVHYIKI